MKQMKQTQIRTKIDLFKALDNLTKADNEYLSVNSDKYQKVEEYKNLIQLTAIGLPKSADISDLSSLDFGEQSLEEYVKNNNVDTVEKRLISIKSDITTRTSQYANTYFEKKEDDKKEKETNIVNFSEELIDVYDKIQSRNHKILIAFAVVFIVFSAIFAVAAICLFIDSFCDFLGENGVTICSAICTVAGVADFINGGAFSIYERFDDKKKSKVRNGAEQSLQTENPAEAFRENSVIKSFINLGGDIRIGDVYYADGVNNEEQRNNMANSASNKVIKTFCSKGNIQIGNTYHHNQKKRERLDKTNEISGNNSTASNNSTEEREELSFEEECRLIHEKNRADDNSKIGGSK